MRRHNDASMLIVFVLLAALSALAPPEPEPEPIPEPPPMETTSVQANAAQAVPLEAVAGLAVLVSPFVLIIAWKRHKRRKTVVVNDVAFHALIRKLDTMSRILEGVTDSE